MARWTTRRGAVVVVVLTVALSTAGTAPLPGGAGGHGTVQATGDLPRPMPGYHHLGATTSGHWSGIVGRLAVRDPGVRPGTHDFVATRFMVKREAVEGTAWLEAGWAETGWGGDGRQRIYTFDSNRNAWTFYDQFRLRDGDQVWLYLSAAPAPRTESTVSWRAWLWWEGGWHLLTSQDLPLGSAARMEQYVEVFVDQRGGGREYPVPPIAVDRVQLRSDGGGLRRWAEAVPTSAGVGWGRYCVRWWSRFDRWLAGDCGEVGVPSD